MHDALLGTAEGDRIRCGLCPHACLIAEGARGVCGARGVVDGKLRALHLRAGQLDRGRSHREEAGLPLLPGLEGACRSARVGCSMRCGHCQNWQISRPKGDDGSVALRYVEPREAVELAARRERRRASPSPTTSRSSGSSACSTSGGSPREAGCSTSWSRTATSRRRGSTLFAEVIDVWRVDIKGFSEEPFRRLCHVGHAEVVREQAVRAKHVHGMHVECVTNVVPTINDSEDELRAIAALDRDATWGRHAVARDPVHPVPRVRRPAADAARHARARARDRARGGPALRLPRQRRRAGRRGHRLPELRRRRWCAGDGFDVLARERWLG